MGNPDIDNNIFETKLSLKVLIDSSPDPVMVVNGKRIIQYVNSVTEQFFFYKKDELIGKPIEILLPDGAKKSHAKSVNDYNLNPQPRLLHEAKDLYAKRKDGHIMPVDISLNPIKTKQDYFVMATVRKKVVEITDIIRENRNGGIFKVKDELMSSDQKFKQLIDTMNEGLMYIDTNRIMHFVNQKFCEFTGYKEDELIGKVSTDILVGSKKEKEFVAKVMKD